MTLILILFLCLLVAGAVEWAIHRRMLARIPLRILVNGTRGKTSVTRLMAGALRAFTMLPTGLVLMGAGLIVGGIGLLCAPLMRGLLDQMVRLSVLTTRAMKHLIVGRERN
ncbi:MAG: hypothetical protein RR843_02070 [Clostridia bacterium]